MCCDGTRRNTDISQVQASNEIQQKNLIHLFYLVYIFQENWVFLQIAVEYNQYICCRSSDSIRSPSQKKKKNSMHQAQLSSLTLHHKAQNHLDKASVTLRMEDREVNVHR